MRTRAHARGHAAVVGGGYAGLVAARVLADRFDRVTVLERDAIAVGRAYRKGTPQSRHPHGLLSRGAEILEDLFPGLRDELAAQGAPVGDFGFFRMLYPTGWSPAIRSGLALQTFSRPLLETTLRHRVLMHPAVTLLDKTQVEGLAVTAGRVTGVRLDDQTALDADIVVIADGPHSRLPAWLAEVGFPEPRTLRVDGRLSYTSRLYKRDPSNGLGLQASVQATFAPTTARGGVVIAIEDDQWLVCLFGANGDSAPTDPDGFTAYAATLANPHIRWVVEECEPVSAIYRYGGLGGYWHRYDRLRPWPGGLVVLGDALCRLNPLYGHGMTVAAAHALLLGKAMDRSPLDTACRRFQRQTRRILRLPWLMSTSLDQGWSRGRPPATAVLVRRALLGLLERIPDDPDLFRRFLNVQHLLSTPLVLLLPSDRRLPSRRQKGAGT
ncbi:FAD-dependent oxidoreductase [Actinomadura rubrisoli]|uniref:FAD-dependent monooxygenase n=1 Tax=Actinomadura rubrisoli TaxID=2530368 RepID=A0A4R5CDA3_9ACTN|nr:FAD-dependent oxidoreductase [Actinomadura rubrisoli]TDD96836.1 FAD-dependent monooxygenase [Actinomadura rubrisoli]